MRMLAGLTQEALANASGLPLDVIDGLESPSGAMPPDEEVQLFKAACEDIGSGQR